MATTQLPGQDIPIQLPDRQIEPVWYGWFKYALATIKSLLADVATNTAKIATNTASIAAHEAAWTAYTPTVTASAGAFTTVSAAGAYLLIGKIVHFTVTVTITNAGTASGDLRVSLPIGTAKRPASVVATESAVIGAVGFGRIGTSGTIIDPVRRYDNGTYIGTGFVVTVTGIYERT